MGDVSNGNLHGEKDSSRSEKATTSKSKRTTAKSSAKSSTGNKKKSDDQTDSASKTARSSKDMHVTAVLADLCQTVKELFWSSLDNVNDRINVLESKGGGGVEETEVYEVHMLDREMPPVKQP